MVRSNVDIHIRARDEATRQMRAVGASIRRLGQQFISMRTLALAGGAALGLSIREFARTGDQLDKMSKRTGFAVEALSELRFAASQTGTDLGGLEKSLARMQRNIVDAERGLSTSIDAFEALGLTLADLQGRAPIDQFTLLAERMNAIADPTRQAGLAMMIFGRSGTAILPMIQEGAEGLGRLRQEARDAGLQMSRESVAAAVKLTDALDKAGRSARMVAVTLGEALSEEMVAVTERIGAAAVAMIEWVDENQEAIKAALKWGAIIGGTIIITGKLIRIYGALKAVVLSLKAAYVALSTAKAFSLALMPGGIIKVGLAAAAATATFFALKNVIEGMGESVGDFREEAEKAEKQEIGFEERVKDRYASMTKAVEDAAAKQAKAHKDKARKIERIEVDSYGKAAARQRQADLALVGGGGGGGSPASRFLSRTETLSTTNFTRQTATSTARLVKLQQAANERLHRIVLIAETNAQGAAVWRAS